MTLLILWQIDSCPSLILECLLDLSEGLLSVIQQVLGLARVDPSDTE